MTPVTELSGCLFNPLYEDDDFVLYRASDERGSSHVLVVAPVVEHPAAATLKRLEREYSLRTELDPAWAARPAALVRHDGRMMLLLEDPGAEPLLRIRGPAPDLAWFLRVASGLSAALGRVHERGLIHKDIKPANVLVDAAGRVWLTGFGIASLLPRERQGPEPPEVIAGTLAYMAPEQTGRMNRSIDSRSDLYSFGVTLYELLTGALPFAAADPMEWVHCHIAKQPRSPGERVKDVPGPISSIIMKLLAKTAEERYQTAAGVEADLRECLAQWESFRRIAPFPLGAHDASGRLLMPEKLYGRDRESQALLDAFERVVESGTPELVLVSGYSGIGKSSVVNELHKAIVLPRGIFASGKFDQYKRGIPYATLAQAFQSLIRQILGKSEAEVAQWRDALRAAVGMHGRLIVDLIPELELVIGRQAPVPDLPPEDAQHRFQTVFRRFLGVFAGPEHPLALFLDDLQWLDSATLGLLEHLITEPEVRHLLLIGAYRDNEVSPSHPLMWTLSAIRKAGARVQEIVLAPLGLDDVGRLVADALHCERERAQPLARLVHEKTGGNPFFAIQFLTALAEQGLLAFEPNAAAWTWDVTRIRAKGYTDNVVDLLTGKLTRLPDVTQGALKQLACLGNLAEIATLIMVLGESEAAIHAALWEAVRAGLVFRQDGAYVFLHDRVQEAAYALIPDGERAAAHLRIGRALASQAAPAELEEKIFEIVNQLNRGAVLISCEGERIRLAELNMIAGRRAKASTAYRSALNHYSAGIGLLGDDPWESRHDLAYQLGFERAEAEYLNRNFDEALRQFDALLARARTKLEKADIYRVVIDIYTTNVDIEKAIACGLDALCLFGVDISPHPSREQVTAEYGAIREGLGGRPIEDLINLPLMTDPEMKAVMAILVILFAPSIAADRNLLLSCCCRMVDMSIRHGNSDASVMAYGYLGMNLGPFFGSYREGFQFGKLGHDLVEKRGLVAYEAKINFIIGAFIQFWSRPLGGSIEYLGAAFKAAVDTGDLNFASYCCDHIVSQRLVAGESLEKVYLESERLLDFTRRTRFDPSSQIIIRAQRFVQSMRGLTANLSTFSGADFDQDEYEELMDRYGWVSVTCGYYIMKLQARVMSGDHGAAIAAGAKARPLLWSIVGMIQEAEYWFYSALALAAHYHQAAPESQQVYLRELIDSRKRLGEWADNCPENFMNRYALVSAEIARLEGRDLEAMHLYEQAIRAAREHGFVQNEGIANELAAGFHRGRGFETIADTYLRSARYCYDRWGAEGKVRQLDRSDMRHLRQQERCAPGPTTLFGASRSELDFVTVVKASQAVSGELVLDRLIETLLSIAVEHAGAERGLLIRPHGAEYDIAAEVVTGRDRVEVTLRQAPITSADLPTAILNYVIRTRENVILDDAAAPNLFSEDAYVRGRRPRSVLCLALVKQGTLVGVLYLENNLTPRAFTADRIAMLELLASQSAISLENARLYTQLQQENSERKRAELSVREREARIRRLVDSNIIGIAFWDVHGRITDANDAFLGIAGYSRQELVSGAIDWGESTPPEFRAVDERALEEIRLTGQCRPYEKEIFRKDESRIPVLLGGARLEGAEDQGVAFFLDLTERKQAEERQKLLLNELNHRVKNTLVIVQAIAGQTLRLADSPKAFTEAFVARLQALSQTQNLLNQTSWQGASLRDIVCLELSPHTDGDAGRFSLTGQEVRLRPEAAVTLGMVFHELATNAAKYGALSLPSGHVQVTWDLNASTAGRRLHLEWQEAHGPPVQAPRRKGFGSRLIERDLGRQLASEVHLEYLSEGVRCVMDLPLERVVV